MRCTHEAIVAATVAAIVGATIEPIGGIEVILF